MPELNYTVHSATPERREAGKNIGGQDYTVVQNCLVVELVGEHNGTIFTFIDDGSGDLAKLFAPGAQVTASFSASK